MKETGVIRRIDELGRIVIPKEIRKNLRIKNADPLEIFVDGDMVVLKKYSTLSKLGEIGAQLAASISKTTDMTAFISDTDKIVFASGKDCEEIINKEIAKEVSKVISLRKSLYKDNGVGEEFAIIFEGELVVSAIIFPILVDGDTYGAIGVYSNEENKWLKEDYKTVMIAVSSFLGEYLE